MVVFMKIGYAIITRARPMALIGTLMTAYKLRASDDVQFACAVDEDDREVVDLARRLANDIPLIVDERPAPSSIGTKWNRLCHDHLRDCDVVCLMTERMVPITSHWDVEIAATLEACPDRPFYWSSPVDQGFAAPCLPRRWLEASKWWPLTERFPFWFTDMWLSEIQAMVHGFPLPYTRAAYAGQRKTTMACRDVPFWTKFYDFLAPERLAEAKRITEALGYVWQGVPLAVARKIDARTQYLRDNGAAMEKIVGDTSPIAERHLVLYHHARKMMESALDRVA